MQAATFKELMEQKVLTAPADVSKTIDHVGLNWLAKYGIMREEIIEHDIRWSSIRHALWFPYRSAGTLEGYQWRFFSPNSTVKWLTMGKVEDLLHILGFKEHPDSPIVIVEDIVSAIKVSRHSRCMPLFGSQMSVRKLMRLKFLCKELLFWLDADKYKESIAQAGRAGSVGLKNRVIYTPYDPKEYEDHMIQNFVRE